MLESFLVTSRETLEASLVIGIVLAYLNRTSNKSYKKTVYYAIVFGVIASILSAFIFTFFAGGFDGRAEMVFEGTTMLAAAFLLTTMMLWMMRQRHISGEIEGKVKRHLMNAHPFLSHAGIFMIVFAAIIREGVETVIFLNAINYASGINFIGGTLGIIAAVIIGYLFFISTKKINLKKLFNISSILLILFAAGLVARSFHEFEEANLVGGIVTPLYDASSFLSDNGLVGGFLKGMFGYNASPSLLEVIAYVYYIALILLLYRGMESSGIKVEKLRGINSYTKN